MDKYHRNLLIAAFVGLVVVAVGAIVFVNRPRSSMGPITSAERAQELAREGKREQIVTVGDGMIPLRDYVAEGEAPSPRLFVIPVGQITLAEPQNFSNASDDSSGRYRGFRGRWFGIGDGRSDDPSPVFGAFNNLVIYDKADGSLKKVFDKRIAVSSFRFMHRTTPRVLVITATSDDSDRNGAVDDSDIQRLYIYTLDGGRLHEVTGIEGSAGTAVSLHDVDYVIVESTLDTDRDGRTGVRSYVGGTGPEPQRLYRVDLKTFAATPVLDQKLVDELQTTLDGVQKSAQAN